MLVLESPTKGSTKSPLGILSAACDWELRLDLEKRLYFPPDIVVTDLRPDIVIWSKSARTVVIGELTVPWETNVDERREFKYTQNKRLSTSCQKVVIIDHFWVVRVVTVTVPFLTTLRAKLGPKVVTMTTQKLSLGCH